MRLPPETGDNEWYTPPDWIERARRAMGGIDLDPASCEFAQRTVRARRWFDKERDGLAQPWSGRVWLNPPYGRDVMLPFIERLVEQYEQGHISQAVALTHNRSGARWFHRALSSASLVAFSRGRIKFVSPSRADSKQFCGSVLFYFGERRAQFAEAFADACAVCEPQARLAA